MMEDIMWYGSFYLVVRDFEKSPYRYFTFLDPDGNPIEVTSGFEEQTAADPAGVLSVSSKI